MKLCICGVNNDDQNLTIFQRFSIYQVKRKCLIWCFLTKLYKGRRKFVDSILDFRSLCWTEIKIFVVLQRNYNWLVILINFTSCYTKINFIRKRLFLYIWNTKQYEEKFKVLLGLLTDNSLSKFIYFYLNLSFWFFTVISFTCHRVKKLLF